MEYQKKFQCWRECPGIDPDLKQEMDKMAQNEEEVANCFSRELAFGTGGIRGRMGAGTARINIYVIRKTTAGLARYLYLARTEKKETPYVVIAYDTRHNSGRFAREAAAVLTFYGIKALIFAEPVPTPLLSFAVRELQASAGVVITASHNPPADNGYKVYGPGGGQITDDMARSITEQIFQVEDELAVPVRDLKEAEKSGLLEWVKDDVEELYFDNLQKLRFSLNWWGKEPLPVRVVYTPLHGTGALAVPRALKSAGIKDLFFVEEQMDMDPHCPTVRSPNPEDWEVFGLAKDLGEKKEADLLLATDLDGDRLGAMVRNGKDRFVPLTGNQIGCLMLDYVLSQRKKEGELSSKGIVVQTVVTTPMGRAIAEGYGVEIIETLTGFKYMGEQIKERVDTGQNVFLFGFEESYGFLAGDFVRDKDGVQASQLMAEITAYYRNKGMTLLDAMDKLYKAYGYFREELVSLELEERDLGRVEKIISRMRTTSLPELAGLKIVRMDDYLEMVSYDLLTGEKKSTGLPSSNSLRYRMEKGAWFCIRPSGTEPKIKIYLGVKENCAERAAAKLAKLKESILAMVSEG